MWRHDGEHDYELAVQSDSLEENHIEEALIYERVAETIMPSNRYDSHESNDDVKMAVIVEDADDLCIPQVAAVPIESVAPPPYSTIMRPRQMEDFSQDTSMDHSCATFYNQPISVDLLAMYLLTAFFGTLGVHHFILGRHRWGFLYLCTGGCLFIGVLVDLIRLPRLCARADTSYSDVYATWGLGFTGIQHFMLKRHFHGIMYFLTLGLFGTGWLVDIVRQFYLVRHPESTINLCEGYIYLLPGGLFGLHHFYLGNKKHGLLYLLTFGLLGFGLLIDIVRMPHLVRAAQFRKRIAGYENE